MHPHRTGVVVLQPMAGQFRVPPTQVAQFRVPCHRLQDDDAGPVGVHAGSPLMADAGQTGESLSLEVEAAQLIVTKRKPEPVPQTKRERVAAATQRATSPKSHAHA
jgi:hypothetical protein